MPRSMSESTDSGNDGEELVVHRLTGYTNVPNDLTNDPRLSFREVGVLVWMLGRPPRWRFAADRTAARSPREGREAILTSLRLLRAAGYVHVTKVRGEGGKIVTRTEVADWPKWTGDGSPDSGPPASGHPASGEPHSSVTTENHYGESEELAPLAPPREVEEPAAKRTAAVLAELFAQWWEVYPRHVAKDAARRAYAKAVKRATPQELLAGAERYRDDPTREPAFTAYPATWLNAGRWADEGPCRPEERLRSRGRAAEGDALLRDEMQRAQDARARELELVGGVPALPPGVEL